VALPQPDPTVLRKAQRGDEQAFASIVRQYESLVFNYVLRFVRDREVAEDLTQEIFFRLFRSMKSFSFDALFTTWLFRVTKNRVIDEVRSMERRPRTVELDDAPPLHVVERPPEVQEMMDAVWRAVGELDVDLKMALLLRDVVGLSYQEIADSLDITLSTVKWRIYCARQSIQDALAREGFDSDSAGVAAS
jgi:RNA polymerase sigma-70 factor, ECF subfamily